MKLNLNLFFRELVLFAAAALLGLFSVNNILQQAIVIKPAVFHYQDIIPLIIFGLILFFLRKVKKAISIIYKALFFIIIFSGSQLIFNSFLPLPFGLAMSIILITLLVLYNNVLVHNSAIIFGIAGISMIIGLSISITSAIIFLIILSFYDILAVYKTRHMVSMAKTMIESGAIFGFIVPPSLSGFMSSKIEARDQIGAQFMILGSGDIALPLIMICAVARVSFAAALITAVFSFVGLFITHLIFTNQKTRQPMAALPPIATMTIIGYLFSQLLS